MFEAAQLRASGVNVIVVPIGEDFANMAEIDGIASEPIDNMVLSVMSFSELPSIVPDVIATLCNSTWCDQKQLT